MFEKDREEALKKSIAVLSDEDLNRIKAEFIDKIKDDSPMIEEYLEGGFDNPRIKKLFYAYLEKRLLTGDDTGLDE